MNKNSRPTISIYIATSIDGYIARRDGSLDWLDRVGGFDEDYGFQKLLDSIDAVILGRNTYEIAAPVPDWPYTGKRIIVLSSTLQTVREGAELFRGDLIQLVSQLYSEGIKHIWIDGGATISQFLDLQMVDSMTLSVIPVILGSGMPLFSAIGKEIPCRLLSSQSYPSGLIQLNYEVVKQFIHPKDNIHFKEVAFGSDAYKKSVSLREEVLRKPLGLFFTPEELALEKEHIHVAGFLGEELCAAAVLVPKGDELKMQRVATKTHLQNKGIGSALMVFCEEHAKKQGYKSIFCHARESAISFYLKNKYAIEGEPFESKGFPVVKMKKTILLF